MDIDTKKLSDDELSVAIKVLEMAEKHKIPFGEDQLQVAFKVAEEAKRQKINLDFVLPLVMQESRFKQNAVSSKGAIGVMQLMPDTATGYKVDPNDLAQNIRGGMLLIKDLASNKLVNNDPIKVLIGYNTKTKTRNKYYETEDPAVLPEETFDYVEKIVGYGGGDLPSVAGGGEGSDASTAVVPDVPKETDTAKSVISEEEPKKDDEGPPKSTISKPLAGAAGAVLGAKAGVVGAVQKAKYDAFAKLVLKNDPNINPKILNKPVSRPALQNWLNSMLAEEGKSVQLPLQKLEEFTGKKIRNMGELGDAYKSIGEIKSERVAKFDPTTGMQRKIYSYTPGRPGMDLSPYQVSSPSAAQKTFDYGRRLLRIPLTGALAGLDVGLTAADVYNRGVAEGDTTGAAVSGVGGLAGLGSLFIPSSGALPAVAVAAPLYNLASDRLKYLEKHPEAYELKQESYDPMGGYTGMVETPEKTVNQTFPIQLKR
jgi:hypothetical protein